MWKKRNTNDTHAIKKKSNSLPLSSKNYANKKTIILWNGAQVPLHFSFKCDLFFRSKCKWFRIKYSFSFVTIFRLFLLLFSGYFGIGYRFFIGKWKRKEKKTFEFQVFRNRCMMSIEIGCGSAPCNTKYTLVHATIIRFPF